ncbi:CLUMA_CG002025, isoform A [Clunio marinus]|uniref:CLUMA_CG002025, isoform A n=1 Tax=Clunio marinus TaxID=568069 RepID=A0A1J1HLF6_9DIPT|nr:CLUMA_CG002025, isoform A [Clunio marinus]
MCLNELYGKDALAYIDDLVCPSKTPEENLQKLRRIFIKFRQNNLSLNPKKCKFLQKSLLFLGHKVGFEGTSLDESRKKNIADFLSRIQDSGKHIIIENNKITEVGKNEIHPQLLALTRSASKQLRLSDDQLFDNFLTTHDVVNKTFNNIKMANDPINEDDADDCVYFINQDLFNRND